MVAAGIIAGLLTALVGERWLTDPLFETSPRDGAVFGTVTVVLVGVALLASALPALRAARVDPARVLREE